VVDREHLQDEREGPRLDVGDDVGALERLGAVVAEVVERRAEGRLVPGGVLVELGEAEDVLGLRAAEPVELAVAVDPAVVLEGDAHVGGVGVAERGEGVVPADGGAEGVDEVDAHVLEAQGAAVGLHGGELAALRHRRGEVGLVRRRAPGEEAAEDRLDVLHVEVGGGGPAGLRDELVDDVEDVRLDVDGVDVRVHEERPRQLHERHGLRRRGRGRDGRHGRRRGDDLAVLDALVLRHAGHRGGPPGVGAGGNGRDHGGAWFDPAGGVGDVALDQAPALGGVFLAAGDEGVELAHGPGARLDVVSGLPVVLVGGVRDDDVVLVDGGHRGLLLVLAALRGRDLGGIHHVDGVHHRLGDAQHRLARVRGGSFGGDEAADGHDRRLGLERVELANDVGAGLPLGVVGVGAVGAVRLLGEEPLVSVELGGLRLPPDGGEVLPQLVLGDLRVGDVLAAELGADLRPHALARHHLAAHEHVERGVIRVAPAHLVDLVLVAERLEQRLVRHLANPHLRPVQSLMLGRYLFLLPWLAALGEARVANFVRGGRLRGRIDGGGRGAWHHRGRRGVANSQSFSQGFYGQRF